MALSPCTTISPHQLSLLTWPPLGVSFLPLCFVKWNLRHLYLFSASLKFDSRLNNSNVVLVCFITTLRSMGFCSVSPVSPSVRVFLSLIIVITLSSTSKFNLYTSLHNPQTNSIYMFTVSSFRFVSGALNIRKFVSLFFLSLIYFTASSTTFSLSWVVCKLLRSCILCNHLLTNDLCYFFSITFRI